MLGRPLFVFLAVSTVLAVVAPSPAAADTLTAEVYLRVGPSGFVVPSHWAVGNPSVWLVEPGTSPLNELPGIAGCLVLASDGNDDGRIDGAEVLGAATGDCITGWAAQDQGFGLFVTSVDGLDAVGWPATYWYIQVNGYSSPVGISDMALGDGSTLDFVYFGGPL